MLTDVELLAVSDADLVTILSPEGLLVLRGLVYRSTEYKANSLYYGDVYNDQLKPIADAAINSGDPEAKAKGRVLAAVINKLKTIPVIVVESEGTANAKSFFGTPPNWDELAQDILDCLYLPPGGSAQQAHQFIVTTRLMPPVCPEWWARDEQFFTTAGWFVR